MLRFCLEPALHITENPQPHPCIRGVQVLTEFPCPEILDSRDANTVSDFIKTNILGVIGDSLRPWRGLVPCTLPWQESLHDAVLRCFTPSAIFLWPDVGGALQIARKVFILSFAVLRPLYSGMWWFAMISQCLLLLVSLKRREQRYRFYLTQDTAKNSVRYKFTKAVAWTLLLQRYPFLLIYCWKNSLLATLLLMVAHVVITTLLRRIMATDRSCHVLGAIGLDLELLILLPATQVSKLIFLVPGYGV